MLLEIKISGAIFYQLQRLELTGRTKGIWNGSHSRIMDGEVGEKAS